MKSQQGTLTIEVIIFGAVAVIVGGGFMLWSITFLNFSLRNLYKVSAFTIAEAGVEYYRWHLDKDGKVLVSLRLISLHLHPAQQS